MMEDIGWILFCFNIIKCGPMEDIDGRMETDDIIKMVINSLY